MISNQQQKGQLSRLQGLMREFDINNTTLEINHNNKNNLQQKEQKVASTISANDNKKAQGQINRLQELLREFTLVT